MASVGHSVAVHVPLIICRISSRTFEASGNLGFDFHCHFCALHMRLAPYLGVGALDSFSSIPRSVRAREPHK
jgi:hypothetical protein